ncbi:MAG: hypothetical protein PF483_09000 [Halothiobacillus sp.]|jgi:hypothetical protein|nr:hypothetical protein [Halothiobacillus sp.]
MNKYLANTLRLSALGCLALSLNLGVAWADPPPWAGGGHDDHRDRHHDRDEGYRDQGDRGDQREYRADHREDERRHERRDHYQITTREQLYINDWYRRHHEGERYRHMPPGQARRLERGEHWPPAYPYEPLPRELVIGLQPLPPGYRYYRVGPDVEIANIAGKVVSDVVYGLLNR